MKKLIIIIALLFAAPVWAGDTVDIVTGDTVYRESMPLEEFLRKYSHPIPMPQVDPPGYSIPKDTIKLECPPCPDLPNQSHDEIMLFDLCEDARNNFVKNNKSKFGFICYHPDKLKNLNSLLSDGWELQEPYRGEDKVYLRRKVK